MRNAGNGSVQSDGACDAPVLATSSDANAAANARWLMARECRLMCVATSITDGGELVAHHGDAIRVDGIVASGDHRERPSRCLSRELDDLTIGPNQARDGLVERAVVLLLHPEFLPA